jgi:hypothetical protein
MTELPTQQDTDGNDIDAPGCEIGNDCDNQISCTVKE